MRTLVAETLAAWRQAERVLAQSEPGTPDHETARMAASQLRDLYQRLTERTGLDPVVGGVVDDATGKLVLERIRSDLGIDVTSEKGSA